MPGSESTARSEAMTGVIFVVPLEGAPAKTGLIMADAIAAEIRDSNHPAILAYEPNQAGASVVGKVITADTRGEVVWLGIEWAIRAPYGTHVATYRQNVVIDTGMWMSAAPEAINLLIGDAAPKLAEMVTANVGPPVLSAMHHAADTPKAAPVLTPPAESQSLAAAPAATPAPPSPVTLNPPTPPAAASVQPLGRIADATNGQVTHPAGSPLASVPETPGVEAAASAPAQESLAEPTGLPSLLQPPPGVSSGSSSGPPRALTPGTASATPPAATKSDASSGGILDSLVPNMDTRERQPDDARPANPASTTFAKVRWGQPSFLIKPVQGAPGNGNEALTAALKSALRDRDLTISEDPRQAGFVIQGVVDTGDPVNGRQYVRIIWQVSTVTGEEVGKAVQENTVVADSLNGEWGHVAEVVSHAAVKGIKDLFGEADDRLTSREPLPEFPDIKLPRVPGRAPPPPASY
ncbi:MAG: hypothetical protein WD075_02105 [Rhodospirillales bacterium]